MIDLVRGAGVVAWLLLTTLAIFSVVSWAIILDRVMLFRKADRQTDAFLETFRGSSKFSQAKEAAAELDTSPCAGMFLAGYAELAAQMEAGKEDNPGADQPTIQLSPLQR